MKNQLIFIIILFISVSSFAQTKEISVGSGVLFNGYTGNVMYRKYKPDFKSAMRFQFSSFNLGMESKNPFQTNFYNLDAVSDDLKNNKWYSFGIGLYIGKQKEINELGKFQFYRGFDIGFRFINYTSRVTENIYSNTINDTLRVYNAVRSESKQRNVSMYYSQFIGFRYQVMPNLLLSLEPTLDLILTRSYSIHSSKNYAITDQTTEVPKYAENYDPTVSYGLSANPTATLWISYRFKGKAK